MILPEFGICIPSIRCIGKNGVQLEIEATPGFPVVVEHSRDMREWRYLATLGNETGEVTFEDTNLSGDRRYYRAVIHSGPQ